MESVVSIAEAVNSGTTSARAVLAEHIARHHSIHPALNALVQTRHGDADREAAALDRQPAGLLAGVPVSVKECFSIEGLVTTLGIPARRGCVDRTDAPIVSRLRRAGALVVGKGNVPQAMYLHDTENPVWGRTNHPLDPQRGPGGSSGGDAALVAAGVVPLALGNDLAGSIRQPAMACGIVGLVPRTATWGGEGAFDTMPHLSVVQSRAGLQARHVADAEQAFRALSSWWQPHPCEPRSLRIAWWDGTGPLAPQASVRRAVGVAVERLATAGVSCRQFDDSLATLAAAVHLGLLSADGGTHVRELFAGTRPVPQVDQLLRRAGIPRWIRPCLAALCRMGGRRIEAEGLRWTGPRHQRGLQELLAARQELVARLEPMAGEYDALICPVSALPALRHGTAARLVLAAVPCMLANLLDLPAGVVPVCRVDPCEEVGRETSADPVVQAAIENERGSAGLPVGVQVIGLDTAPGRGEATVLEIMRLIERHGLLWS